MDILNTATVIMACVSLLLSLITIYFTFFRPAKLKIFVGPFIIICRQKTYLNFSIPVTIANQSNQTGVIKRCTLVLTHKDIPQQNYHMTWHSFDKLNPEGTRWVQSDTVSSIPVIAKSTETRNIAFSWFFKSNNELQFKEGVHQLNFYFWSHKSKLITHLNHEIYINADQANHLNNPEKEGKIIQISIDNDLNANEILTSKQVEMLKHK